MEPWEFRALAGSEKIEYYRYFLQFLSIGPSRKLAQFGKKAKVDRNKYYYWAKAYNWIERAEAFDSVHGLTIRSTAADLQAALIKSALPGEWDEAGPDTEPIDVVATAVETNESLTPSPPPGHAGAGDDGQREAAPIDRESAGPELLPLPKTRSGSVRHLTTRQRRHMELIADLREQIINHGRDQLKVSEFMLRQVKARISKMLLAEEEIPIHLLPSITSAAVALSKQGYENQSKGLGIDHMLIMLEGAMADDIAQMAAAEEATGPVDA